MGLYLNRRQAETPIPCFGGERSCHQISFYIFICPSPCVYCVILSFFYFSEQTNFGEKGHFIILISLLFIIMDSSMLICLLAAVLWRIYVIFFLLLTSRISPVCSLFC